MTSEGDERRAGRRSGNGRERKERVLHTRVSERLAGDIRRIAGDLRVPASNLVRNVLEEVFDVVESVSEDVGELFEEVIDEAQAARDRIRRTRTRPTREASKPADRAPPPPPSSVEWYFAEGGLCVGPVTSQQLATEAQAGRVLRHTQVWCAGMPEWVAAAEAPGLAELFAPPPLPPT